MFKSNDDHILFTRCPSYSHKCVYPRVCTHTHVPINIISLLNRYTMHTYLPTYQRRNRYVFACHGHPLLFISSLSLQSIVYKRDEYHRIKWKSSSSFWWIAAQFSFVSFCSVIRNWIEDKLERVNNIRISTASRLNAQPKNMTDEQVWRAEERTYLCVCVWNIPWVDE